MSKTIFDLQNLFAELPAGGTHLPHLYDALTRTPGPVLELGMGQYSSPALHAVAEQTGRLVFSLENDREYIQQWLSMRGQYHKIALVSNWDIFPPKFWGVVLVDQSPGGARAASIRQLAYQAEVIVAHDSEPEEDACYGYAAVRGLFAYAQDRRDSKPHTLLLSNYVDVSAW